MARIILGVDPGTTVLGYGIVKVEGNYAYLGAMGLGVVILDISDPNNIAFVSELLLHVACDNGTYGLNCDFHCGACLNSEQCHHMNGACLNGCDPGFQGGLCKESKLLIIHVHLIFILLCCHVRGVSYSNA